jgi:serine/threonine protein phosphatase 1
MRWVIGDVHGMLRALQGLLAAVRAVDPGAAFFFVGDYVNRGADSRGVIDLLLTLDGARFVRGNHDDIFDLVLNGHGYDLHPQAREPLVAFLWFIQHGLWETLNSYGVDDVDIERVVRRPSEEGLRRLLEPIPQSHRRFIRELPPVVETDDFFVLHACWDPDDPDERPSILDQLESRPRLRHKVLWGRYANELARKKRWRRTGFFGHTPVENYPPSLRNGFGNVPIRGPRIVLLDTAAALIPTGRLSAVCADEDRLIQVDRLGKPVSGA